MWGIAQCTKAFVENEWTNVSELCMVGDVVGYGSETLRLRKNEMVILKGNQRAMTRAMRGVKLIEKMSSQELVAFAPL